MPPTSWAGTAGEQGGPRRRAEWTAALQCFAVAWQQRQTCQRAPPADALCLCLHSRRGCRGCQLALDIAEGLAFLHTHMNCLHADLKARWAVQWGV